MLEAGLKTQVSGHFEKLTAAVEIIASLDGSPKSAELDSLLAELSQLSDKLTYSRNGDAPRKPSFVLRRVDSDVEVSFAAIPLGHEFTSLILAVLQVGGYPPKLDDETADRVRNLDGDYTFETFMSLSCQSCPETVQSLNAMSVLNPRITHIAVDGGLFQAEVEQRQVMSVPTIFLNGEFFETGRMSVEQILAQLGAAHAPEELTAKPPFDVLIVGSGPAGSSAAIYAARKGIRTGIVAERIGGQLLDTLGIENLPSVTYTEGPKLAAELEAHVRANDVEIMPAHRAHGLSVTDGVIQIDLESGASLRGRSVVLATGARWRHIGVPGEQEYRTRGVTYCPHCDGPLFKGKRVAVVGGGNSGVEAAIDLAGIVEHVTLLEFGGSLGADEVLQRKLKSLANIEVIVDAETTEIHGDGTKVTGLSYRDRQSNSVEHVLLAGVFVQIGLLPSTEWLHGALELNDHNEIVVDDHGRTSVPGVFAAGDATTAPYKQIVTSMGSGSAAAISAFDYLIRS